MDEDKFVPLQKMLQEDAPIAGTSKTADEDTDDEYSKDIESVDYNSDEDSTEQKPKIAKKKESTFSVKLPQHLKGLMGEANLRFARGNRLCTTKLSLIDFV